MSPDRRGPNMFVLTLLSTPEAIPLKACDEANHSGIKLTSLLLFFLKKGAQIFYRTTHEAFILCFHHTIPYYHIILQVCLSISSILPITRVHSQPSFLSHFVHSHLSNIIFFMGYVTNEQKYNIDITKFKMDKKCSQIFLFPLLKGLI